MFPSAAPRGNIEILGKQNELFPSGPVIKCLLLACNNLLSYNFGAVGAILCDCFDFPLIRVAMGVDNRKTGHGWRVQIALSTSIEALGLSELRTSSVEANS